MTRFEIVCAALIVLGLSWSVEAQPPGCDATEGESYVYVRMERHRTPVGPADDAANWQHLSDVGRPYVFAESEVVIENGLGLVRSIHKEKDCAAHEPKVSPDGTQVVYALSCGEPTAKIRVAGIETSLHDIRTTTSDLYLYDIATKRRTRLTEGHYDRQPFWCGLNEICFSSDRAGTYAPMAYNGVRYPGKAWHIHKGTIKAGKLEGIRNLTPHALYAQNGVVSTSEEILYSCWRGEGPDVKPSPNNYWNICAMGLNGENGRVMLAAHDFPNLTRIAGKWTGGQGLVGKLALRPVAEVSRGKYCTGNYYRGNGPGDILCWSHLDVEGARLLKNVINAYANTGPRAEVPGSGMFTPPDLTAATPFAQAQDLSAPRYDDKGRASGRTSHPAAGPNGNFLFTWGRGYCYEALWPSRATVAFMGGEPTCKREIRLALKDIVVDPFTESVCVAGCEDEWQAFDAQWVKPYKDIYGVDFPTAEPLTGEKCFVEVEHVRLNELFDHPLYAAQVGGFRLTPVEQWPTKPNSQGHYKKGTPIDYPILENGSVFGEAPCDTPLIMEGIDKDKNVIVTDPMLHSIRAGETRTCKGCHEGHSVERVEQLGATPEQ